MSDTLIVALISFVGTLLGTFGGIITSGKLVNYRIEQLEKKVESLAYLASKVPIMEEQIKILKKENFYENFKMDNSPYCNDSHSGA